MLYLKNTAKRLKETLLLGFKVNVNEDSKEKTI